MSMEAWLIWLAAGVALMIVEVFTATFFVACFAIAAWAAALTAALNAGLGVQMITFAITGALAVIFSQRAAHMLQRESPKDANVDRLKGQEAIVLKEFSSGQTCGRVKVCGEEWLAKASGPELSFKENERVKVEHAAGTRVVISKL